MLLHPLLRCITKDETKKVLMEVYEGSCSNHTGEQTLANKVLCYRYFWFIINRDTADYAKLCDRCQRFSKLPRIPSSQLTQMVSPWPFAVWGIDLIGVLPIVKEVAKYAIVVVDYFTKWTKAEPLATITTLAGLEYHIICRFEVPHKFITDNRTQFVSDEFKDFCRRYWIEKNFFMVVHPQKNGQVEAVNKIIKSTIKMRLMKAKENWVDELTLALWAYKTTHKFTAWHSPFALVYNSEAMILVELDVPSYRRCHFNQNENE